MKSRAKSNGENNHQIEIENARTQHAELNDIFI